MKEYIKYTDNGLVCTHKQVTKMHQWGGGPANGPFYDYISLKMKDGQEHEFKALADKYHDSIEDCNKFLNTIPE
jgi:hypothetical protein